MAHEVDQVNLPVYRGQFTFNPEQLQNDLEKALPDYDYCDPKTWPVITSEHLHECIGHEYEGAQMLPAYVAYERELINKCIVQWPDKAIDVMRSDGETTPRGRNFHHFPFVYNSQGVARKFLYMHADLYISWVSSVTGKVPNTRTKGKDASQHTSSSAFDEVLEMLRDTQPDARTNNIECLKHELAKTQKELARTEQRADTAEKERDTIKNNLEKKLGDETRRAESVTQSFKTLKADLKGALAEEERQHTFTKESYAIDRLKLMAANNVRDKEADRANTAEATIEWQADKIDPKDKELKTMKKEVKSLGKELASSRNEAVTVNGQMNTIRDELRKMKENASGKRQGKDEAPSSQSKKVKTEK